MREPPGFLRALLRLYPASHRRRYGEEMWQAVRHRYRRTGGPGPVRTAWDLAWSAIGVWWDRTWRGMMGIGRGWVLDVRFVLRSMRRAPGYALTSVGVLTVAVAAVATVFAYVRGTLLTSPPYPEADRVVVVWGSNPRDGQLRDVVSGPTYVHLAERARSVADLAAFHYDGTYLTVEGHPEVMTAVDVTVDFFDVVRVAPFMGRDFDERDRYSGGELAVIVSYAFWRDRLGSDPEVVGSSLALEGEPHTIIGVLPEGFEFLAPSPLYRPMPDDVLAADNPYRIHYNVVGRLADGATAGASTREMSTIFDRLRREDQRFARYEGWSILVEPLHHVSVAAVRPAIWTLAAAVALVLLVALVNLATLFRTRTLARTEELGLRMALGSGWLRVARVLGLETLGLAATGAVGGLLLAPWLLGRVRGMIPTWIAIPDSAARIPALQATLDPAVVAISFAGAVLGALVLTLPSLALARPGRGVGRGTRVHAGVRGTRLLVGVELAVATVLCLGAGLTTRSAARMLSADVGLREEGLLTLYFGDRWNDDPRQQVAYFEAVIRSVEAIPGVRSASTIDYVDFTAEDDYQRVYFLDDAFQPVSDIREEWRRIGPRLFETAGMEIVAGRGFGPDDFRGPVRAVVVNRAFAEKHNPERDPLGSYLSLGDTAYRDMEIVGVVESLRSLGPATPPPPMLYVPWNASERGTQGLYVRVEGEPMSFAARVQDAIWSVDPSQPVIDFVPMATLVDSWVAVPRATRTLVSALAGLALVLSALGIFGVVAYAVRTRRSELGVRLALGATPDRLEADLLGGVVPVVALGVGVGLVIGVLAARVARSVLFEVAPADPLSMAGALTAIAAAALLASWLPARRVSRIDPVEAIRAE